MTQAKFTKLLQSQPESFQHLVRIIVSQIQPQKIILFGSRARGDNRDNSDFDIAVTGPVDQNKWTALMGDLEEKNISLYPIDLVQLVDLNDEYKSNIARDGKMLYG